MAIQAGASAFLQKPVKTDELLSALQRALMGGTTCFPSSMDTA
jgi:DNA-binding NarL/FixJ family response regulator